MTRDEVDAALLREIEPAVDALRRGLGSLRHEVDVALERVESIHVGSPGVETAAAVTQAQGLLRLAERVNMRATELGGLVESLALVRSITQEDPCPPTRSAAPSPAAATRTT